MFCLRQLDDTRDHPGHGSQSLPSPRVRNLERAGVSRSAAMKMAGHKTQSIYSRYGIADESMLQDGGTRLSALHAKEAEAARVVVPITEDPIGIEQSPGEIWG